MSLLFANTHNVVTILEKSDAAEGFEQIIDFLSGSYILYALTVSPPIYISCIKQFWNSVSVKRSGDVTRVGKGFSGVETPLFEGMIAERQSAEEELGAEQVQGDAAAVVEDVTKDVAHMSTPSPPPHGISSPTQEPSSPPHQPPCPPQPQDAEGLSLLFQRVLDTCFALALRVAGLENDKATQQLEIVKLKAWVKKLEKINKVKSSKLRRLKKVGTSQRVKSSDDMENVFNQGRIIVDMDQDEGIELVADQEKDAEFKGRHADKQVKIYNIDLDHSSKVLSMQEYDTEVQEAVEILTTAKLMTEVVTAAATQVDAASTHIPAAKPKILIITAAPAISTRKRKGVVIRDPEEELPSDTQLRYPKMDFFKGKKYDEILPIFQAKFDANMRFLFKSREEMEAEDEEIIKSINETPTQKAAKRRKLSEEAQEAEDLRKKLEIVQDEDDDVFVEATPLAQKVPLSRFTLEQLVNVARLQVEEESEMSLELLRFTRQQLQEYQQG
nr:hypothetical protein [Tanacetum cinerariifolium]